VDKQYEIYCLADPTFYDTPDRGLAAGADFDIASRELPEGWQRATRGEWTVLQPARPIPPQGWKVHVSGCLDNAEHVLSVVWDYCVPRDVSFKFLRGRLLVHMRNAKYAPRGASGKLVTIYPVDDAHCELICDELGALLAGQPGPYILTDLRIGAGPLYVRYGGFAQRYCEDGGGELVAAIEDADGRLVPDRRDPVFSTPPWVTLPAFLEPHVAARGAASTTELPYRIHEALHFSNGGGVYVATDTRTGEEVVVKEARPHAGLAGDGADAVTRLEREHDLLSRLAGLDVVPDVRDYFQVDGHHFLVQELIEGRTLNTFFAEKHPYLDPEPDPERIAGYTAWALKIYDGIERAVAAIHERGIVFNDLHIFNVMVRPDETVALIDFEAAAHVDEGRRPTIGNPGFVAPRDRRGFAIDRYSLACMRLAMFAPLTTLIALDRAKAAHLAEMIAELFPVDREFVDEAAQEIMSSPDAPAANAGAAARPPELVPGREGWEPARDRLTRAIVGSATPSRDDRLFPGDVRQFGIGGGVGLANGAAGVLYALAMTGAERQPEHEQWLIEHATRPAQGTPVGLYDGLLGSAYVLELLGHRGAALQVVDLFLGERWERLGPDLFSGLAGAALVLGHLGDVTGERSLCDASLRAADIVAGRSRADRSGDGGDRSERRVGLLYGAAGHALLFVRLYERTGDTAHLDHAAEALRTDLDRCVFDRNGALHVDDGWRVLPYLGRGSVGVGCVLDDYLRHREDERFAAAAAGARRAAQSPYYAESGLISGRAGMILYLSRQHPPGLAAGDPHVAAHVRRLSWHAVAYGGGLAFPGENLFRLSMDLGTGTAGVLLALGAALSAQPAHLPFLDPTHQHPRRPSGGPKNP
jgi:tRNA A-37 threonylcarbamoyl transferase component Bud32